MRLELPATLQALKLAGNALSALTLAPLSPDDDDAPLALASLDVCDNALVEVPSGVGGAGSLLTTLKLRGNQIAALPAALASSPRLMELDLTDNSLTALPDRLEGLVGLRKLSVGRNQLVALPESVWRLPALLELHASHSPKRRQTRLACRTPSKQQRRVAVL